MYQATFVQIAQAGELVVVQVGNLSWSLEFDKALKLSAQMMAAGRVAKRADGNDTHRYRMAGSMVDANAVKQSKFAAKPPPVEKRASAIPNGTIVVVTIGGTSMDIPYEAAFQIAQWLRVHGKEARNAAGETAHWSKIANAAEAAARLQ
jgi:hypothetical protein